MSDTPGQQGQPQPPPPGAPPPFTPENATEGRGSKRSMIVVIIVVAVIGVLAALAIVVAALAIFVVGSRDDATPAAGSAPTDNADSEALEVPRSDLPPGLEGGYVAPVVNTVAASECSMFPADNVWHSVIDGPEVPLVADDDPAAILLAAATGPARTTFSSEIGEGLNVVPSADSQVRPVSIAPNWLAASNQKVAAASDADRSVPGPLTAPQLFLDLEAPSNGTLRWSNMSLDPATDNRLYLVDTESCVATEFIGFSGLVLRGGGGMVANRSSRFDLRSNNRRASRWWGEGPCPDIATNPFFNPGCDGSTVKRSAARGGSGLSGTGGLVRFEEIGSDAGIDHAIGVVLPRNMIAEDGFTWPATVSDGTGQPGSLAGSPEGSGPIPMGARLRLRDDFALDCDPSSCPQATEVVRALKRHGMIVVDSMGPVQNLDEAGVHIVGELSDEWDRKDLRRVEFRGDNTSAMRLSDFELIDAQDMRALPDAGPQDDDWLQVR
ncbi:MAG: hypothetical protein ACR2OH_04555 [Microthrixaceae bacterium]